MMSEGDAIIERMYECMDLFSEATNAWFKHAFNAPTEAQRLAWPAICSGENVLVVAPTGSGKTLCAFLSAIDRLMTKEGDDLLRTSGGGDGTAESDCNAKKRKPVRGVKVLYISPLKALGVDVAKNLQAPLAGIAGQCEAMGLPSPKVSVGIRSGDTTPQERRRIVSHPPDILVTTPESLFLLLTSKARRILSAVDTVIVDEVHAIAGSKRGAHLALSLERLESLAGRSVQRIGLSATVEPPAEAARFLGGTRPVRVIRPESHPDMDLKVVEPLSAMRDPVSDDAGRRAGAVKLPNRHTTHISGVGPAMEALAERKGLTSVGGDEHTSRVSTGGSVWPAIERSVLDEVLKHHTTLVFVNSRGLAEKLTARLNDLYAQLRTSRKTGSETAVKADAGRDALSDRRLGRTDLSVSDNASQPESTASDSTQPYPDLGSPEGREGFAKHYDSVVGSTTMLVSSHADADAIAMAHHGSVSKDRRKQIEEQLKRGQLRCVVATSSLELGIDMGSVDLVIQIAPPLSVSSGLQRVGRADHKVGGVSHALFYPITREQIIGTAASIECMRSGDIETLTIPCTPLDVLAQQTVAAAAMDDLKPDDWYVTVRKAAPFEDLDRTMFDAVMGMMTGAYNGEDFSAFRPPLQYNEEAGPAEAPYPTEEPTPWCFPKKAPDRAHAKWGSWMRKWCTNPGLETSSPSAHRPGRSRKSPGTVWWWFLLQGVPPDCRSGMAKATGGTRHSDGPKADSYAIWRKDYARKSRTASQETRPADSTRQQSHVYVVTDWTTTPSAILPTCLPNSAPPRERFPTTVSWSSNAARMKKAIGV